MGGAEGAGRKAGAQPSGSCSPRGSAILAPPEHRPWGAPWPPSWAGGEASVWGRGRGHREGVLDWWLCFYLELGEL